MTSPDLTYNGHLLEISIEATGDSEDPRDITSIELTVADADGTVIKLIANPTLAIDPRWHAAIRRIADLAEEITNAEAAEAIAEASDIAEGTSSDEALSEQECAEMLNQYLYGALTPLDRYRFIRSIYHDTNLDDAHWLRIIAYHSGRPIEDLHRMLDQAAAGEIGNPPR